MADRASKASGLIETFWSLLLLGCMGLALAHIVSSVQAQSGPDEEIIERTFTTIRAEE